MGGIPNAIVKVIILYGRRFRCGPLRLMHKTPSRRPLNDFLTLGDPRSSEALPFAVSLIVGESLVEVFLDRFSRPILVADRSNSLTELASHGGPFTGFVSLSLFGPLL
jgi:hypothetical protein